MMIITPAEAQHLWIVGIVSTLLTGLIMLAVSYIVSVIGRRRE